jgi:hypothetical protein
MRLLYLPNEPTLGWQVGARDALAKLRADGALSDLQVYSFLQEHATVAVSDILNLCNEHRPDAVLFTKIDRFPLTPGMLESLRRSSSRPTIAYYDADVYGTIFKRFSPQMKLMCGQADLTFLCGLGRNATRFERHGARKIYYIPHTASKAQFGQSIALSQNRDFDVVLIGNRIQSRLSLLNNVSFARTPGAYERESLVRKLGAVFGNRFGVFGRGWDGYIGNRGPIAFDKQHDVLRKSWLSVGYEHFPGTPYYFSDRLPIALMAGVAHLVHFHPGYDALFTNGDEILWADSVDEIVDLARFALSMGPDYLDRLGARGREFALKNLTSESAYSAIVRKIGENLSPPSSTTARTAA